MPQRQSLPQKVKVQEMVLVLVVSVQCNYTCKHYTGFDIINAMHTQHIKSRHDHVSPIRHKQTLHKT